MKPRFFAALLAALMIFPLTGCKKSLLDKDDPVTLTFWHVYGEQSGSPMDELVDEFNRTVGAEKGVRVTVTATSSASQIGAFLLQAQAGGSELPEMPDVFTCHIGDALALGAENLLDWNSLFTEDEREEFVSGFLADGTADGRLLVFPMSKSTHVLMLNGSAFDRFSAATGAQYSDLTTWEGFYQTAGAFYDYSGGKTFWTILSAPWSCGPWSRVRRISIPRTAGTTRTTPSSRRAGWNLPDLWCRGISRCPTAIPIRRS